MSKERKPSTLITLDMKVSVIRDYLAAPDLQKTELAKMHGISATSVSRILSNREELVAMSGLSVEDQNLLLTEKVPVKKKRTTNSKDRSKQQNNPRDPVVPNVTIAMDQNHVIYQPICEDSQNTMDSLYLDYPVIREDPEVSFERALKQLEQYTVEIIACDLLTVTSETNPPIQRLFDELYQFYEELLESEYRTGSCLY